MALGDYINLGTNLLDKTNVKLGANNETMKADWRVFYKDGSNGVYAILADYLPISNMPSEHGLTTSGTYVVKSGTSRQDLLLRLNNETVWKNLLTGTSLASNSRVTVKGGIDLETWVKSWNSNGGYTELTTNMGGYGYYIGAGYAGMSITSTNYNLGSTAGYSNTLYFPHKVIYSSCNGAWLASPSAFGNLQVMNVDYSGRVGDYRYNDTPFGVRPAVYLPSDVLLNKDGNGVWQLQ